MFDTPGGHPTIIKEQILGLYEFVHSMIMSLGVLLDWDMFMNHIFLVVGYIYYVLSGCETKG